MASNYTTLPVVNTNSGSNSPFNAYSGGQFNTLLGSNWGNFNPNPSSFNIYQNGAFQGPLDPNAMTVDLSNLHLANPYGTGGGSSWFGNNSFLGKAGNFLGSPAGQGLGTFLNAGASLLGAYWSKKGNDEYLDMLKEGNADKRLFGKTMLNNEVALANSRLADQGAMRGFSISGESDAVTPEQLASWGKAKKDEVGLQSIA